MRVNRRLIPQLEAWSPTLSPSLYRCTSDTPEQLPSSKPEFELAESLESESTSPPQTDLILSTRCSVVRLVRGLRELVHTKVLQRIEREMLLEMIKQTPIAEASLQSLTSSELKSVAAVIPLIVPTRWHKPAPAWIVHVPASLIPNLAKQLSVLASAIAISVRTKRQLVLFWEVGSSRSIFSVLDSSPAFTNVTVLYERLLPVLEEPPFVFLGSLPAPERSSRAESSRPSQRLTLQLLQTEHAPIVVSARAHLTVPDEDFSGTIENEEVRLLRKLRPSRLLKQANRLSVQKALETAVESAQNHKRASTPSIESSED